MVLSKDQSDSTAHNRWLAGFAFLTFAVTLILMYAGGFTTTIGAGMVFPDWPLSNGSLNPPGWTTDEAMLAEHSHRLLGAVVGMMCIGLLVFLHASKPPVERWLKIAGWLALCLVVFQGLLGGLRVLLVSLDLAKIHGVTAQIFLCLLVAISVGTSAWWKRLKVPASDSEKQVWRGHRIVGGILVALIIGQLVIGAILRHRGAGLAIPYFPHSAPDGSFLPVAWTWATQIHFAHRAMALLIYVLLISWLVRLIRQAEIPRPVIRLGWAAFFLVHVQILLGALIIWNVRQPMETTLHVLNGAIFLSVCWAMTFVFWKPALCGGATISQSAAEHNGSYQATKDSIPT